MDCWEKFNETSSPEKEDLYSHLNIEDINDEDCTKNKKVCKYFKVKNLGEYYDLYVQCNTLMLADVFNNFRNIVLKYMNCIQQDLFQPSASSLKKC